MLEVDTPIWKYPRWCVR